MGAGTAHANASKVLYKRLLLESMSRGEFFQTNAIPSPSCLGLENYVKELATEPTLVGSEPRHSIQ